MRIAVLTVGTTGDVLPFCVLGQALVRRGHAVVVSTFEAHRATVEAHGLRFLRAPGEPRRVATSVRRLVGTDSAAGWVAACTTRRARIAALGLRLAAPMVEACSDADLVVFNSTAAVGASIAEALGVASLHVAFMPLTPSRRLPAPGWPAWLSHPPLNAFGHWLLPALRNEPYRAAVNALRSRLGLRALPPGPLFRRLDDAAAPTLYAFSPAAVPPPPDWKPEVTVGGYLNGDEGAVPSELEAFVRAGPPPVSAGLGSAVVSDPDTATAAIVGAARRLGVRVVLHRGWNGLGRGAHSESVLVVDHVPHRWLFPRCACVVHHGGCSTTGAALASGRPQVVVPHSADQPYWASRMHAMGVAPPPVRPKPLDADALARAIGRALADPTMQARARALGEAVRAEDGVGRAVALIEGLAAPARQIS